MKTRPTLLAAVIAPLLFAAFGAEAHARLIKSEPKVGAASAAPKQLRLWFSETIVPGKSSVSLAGPAGAAALGELAVDPKNPRLVVAPITSPLKPGAYKVTWSMTTADTHTMGGSFGFKVK